MNYKLTSALLAAGALMMACGDDTVVNVNDEAKEKANVTLRVVDAYTGEAVPGVSVYSVIDDETVTSDSLGVATFKKNVIGAYEYLVSAEGYKTVRTVVDVSEGGKGDVSRVSDVLEIVDMYKGGVEASGSVLYENDKGEKKAAAKVTVYANCGDRFVPSEVTVTTNDKGEYAFDDLPAGATCAISVGQKSFDKSLYGCGDTRAVTGLRSGDVAKLNIMTMTQIKTQLVKISDNFNKIEEATALNISFSAELDADSVANKWNVYSGSTKVLTTVALGSDKKSVTIKPYSGKWDKDASYTVSGVAYSKEGTKVTVNDDFSVGGGSSSAPAQVTDFKVTTSTSYDMVLTWTAPKGSFSGYRLYYKTDKMADVLELATFSATKTTASYDYDDIEYPVDYTSIKFILLPYNSDGVEADITKATVVTHKVVTSDED